MDAYIVGTHCTHFGKLPDKSFKDLTRESYRGVLADAGLENGEDIENAWFSNCGMGTFGQRNIRGQVCFTPLVREGLFPERVGMTNVEGGCASASMALQGAWKDILSGTADVSLAIGVEKTFVKDDPERTREIFEGGIDRFDVEECQEYYRSAGEEANKPFLPNAGGGTLFMDTYAMQAAYHMARYGTTKRQLAMAASKNHYFGSLNPLAQYQFTVSVEDALADRVISDPITRSMCAPIGDGAAAAIVVSERYLERLPRSVRERAIKIRACTLSGGKYRRLDEPGLSQIAADRAYEAAGVEPEDIDVAELHDATAFSEIYQPEMLRFCPEGGGGAFVESGASSMGGRLPINTSGGLESKGHPVGATGLSMIYELCVQLRGEAGPRQVPDARLALAENGGGTMGFDEAACSVTILERGV
ncbi:MAG: Thiolase [Caulobacteraceae bacterium]|nr:Thiolase [Caulobacteraceae bacterium]